MNFHKWSDFDRSYTSSVSLERLAYMVHSWKESRCPYYKVWPAILPALTKVSLDVKLSDLSLGLRTILIRFAESNEPDMGELGKMHWILTAYEQFSDCCSLAVETGLLHPSGFGCGIFWLRTIDDGTIEDQLSTVPPQSNDDAITHSITPMSFRIALTVHLLADDPSIITPDVLAKDRDRYDSETDEKWKQRAVDRARRRGVVGWNIGADYEVCPHYRRPHFGLRHTGKGGTVPRIVPIKGAVVHRSKLTEVPTGYMLPDGTEVESNG